MEKHEVFNQALEKNLFEGRKKEDLLSVGITLGSNHTTFKNLYTAYFTNEDVYENNPRIGAKIKVEFDRANEKIIIKQVETELTFNTQEFLNYLNLLALCFGDTYPLGSVVELDELLFTENFKKASGIKEGEHSVWVVITERFVATEDAFDQYFVDYVATPYPYGGTKMFLNRVMIKGVVHKGLSDEAEEEYASQLREALVVSNKKSTAFLTDAELEGLFNQATIHEYDNMIEDGVN